MIPKPDGSGMVATATDLSQFLECRHRTALEMGAARGRWDRPRFEDPRLEALLERGREHERRYVEILRAEHGVEVTDLTATDGRDRPALLARTVQAMRAGVDLIVQGALGDADWFGRPDILKKVTRPSSLGEWSYEAIDAKLALETKAGTILQLALYSDLLGRAQGVAPEHLHVLTPIELETYRVDDSAAFFRAVKARLMASLAEHEDALASSNYPEPVAHCAICPWFSRCDRRRRDDDHLSIVAGASRLQRAELSVQGIATMTALAGLAGRPLPFVPSRGSSEALERAADQARLQVDSRGSAVPQVAWLRTAPSADGEAAVGLGRLPAPSDGDIFLDLEGDPFAGPSGNPSLRGREYLFGIVTVDGGTPTYRAYWAKSAADERLQFEAVMDFIIDRLTAWPDLHIYHYAPYEPGAFKRLMGRYATRQEAVDALLRAERFVDLYRVVREGLRAGVERYSIKNLEPMYGFVRVVDLAHARGNLIEMELAVENDAVLSLDRSVLDAVEGYNRDDCLSLVHLRGWLEAARPQDLPRPVLKQGEASPELDAKAQAVEALRARLLDDGGEARRLLAYMLDYHRREDKAGWWEYFRLRGLPAEDLLDEAKGIGRLEFTGEVRQIKRSRVLRFSFAPQLCEVKEGDTLRIDDGKKWGEIDAIDRNARTIDVLIGPSNIDLRPTAAFVQDVIPNPEAEQALFEIGQSLVGGEASPLAQALIERRTPAVFDAMSLNNDVLAVQGPPGTGKTYNGARMICDLVSAGRKVGVTGSSHKVIDNLLKAVRNEAAARHQQIGLGHKDDPDEPVEGVKYFKTNDAAEASLAGGETQVLGGTPWLWPRDEFADSVDVLVIDEAGQLALADALAMTRAANSLILLGDPQQLAQVTTGSHPPGVGASALEHILGSSKTMPEDRGRFLGQTFRFGRRLCAFTSELFYEGRLEPTGERDLERQALSRGPIEGAGLFIVDVSHSGNRNGSDEEVEAVARLVDRLVATGSVWTDHEGVTRALGRGDLRVIAPYNVQVARLKNRLGPDVACGTVDKFQGQEAPVVMYSMATSTPDDAPRGLEFLYSLSRFNVATSRAQAVVIVVASPALVEAACATPRQVQLLNALCRYRELAQPLTVS